MSISSILSCVHASNLCLLSPHRSSCLAVSPRFHCQSFQGTPLRDQGPRVLDRYRFVKVLPTLFTCLLQICAMPDEAMEIVPVWSVVHQSILDPRESNLAVEHAHCMVPGLSAFNLDDVDKLRKAIGHMRWLSVVYAEASKSTSSSAARAQLTLAQKDARLILVDEDLPESDLPFRSLEMRGCKSVSAVLNSEESGTCAFSWGPNPGPARDLLSPAFMAVMCWLGPKYSMAVLDLAFAFARDVKSFKMAWLNCPAVSDFLDMIAVEKRASTLRSSPATNSPGAAVIHLAKLAESALFDVVHAIFHSFASRNYCSEQIKEPQGIVNVADMVKSEAIQYKDCTISAVVQVQSKLPTLSSLPDLEPQFGDDRSHTWFRTAEYTFKNVKFPSFFGHKGDQVSELRWHKFQSDVLHARALCTQLSEKQVIQHLMSSMSRTEQHFALAQQTALQAHCTTRQWLETIRDYYFTNGQFRHNIERAWQSYSADESVDFNELMHHISEYYRLIFLDYAHMPGKQSKLDFACILFVKLQTLMQPSTTSPVTHTLAMFMPLSQLVSKFNDELKPAMNECTDRADVIATSFIEWAITQLLRVRESANTVRRYALPDTDTQFDYARLQGRRKPSRGLPEPHQLQAAAAAHSPDRPLRVQQRQPQKGGPRPAHIPNLKEACNTDSPQTLRSFVTTLRANPDANLTAEFDTALDLELKGGDTSLHGALAHASEPLTAVKPTFISCMQLLLKVYFLYRYKQCGLCPPCRADPASGMHALDQCPTFSRVVPPAAAKKFFSNEFNRRRKFSPMPAGYDSAVPAERTDKGKRDRYDPIRKGLNKPKRTRPSTDAAAHIR